MKSKGIYIAGGNQHAGKTTLSLGLVKHFNERLNGRVSFIKPIGQKSMSVDGEDVGQDSYLLNKALDLDIPLQHSAPFSSGSGAAYKYIKEEEPRDIPARIKKAYKHLSSKSDLIIVEGTGHPGVGSVFDLSNGKIASLLNTPTLLILNAGIGSTIDRFTLCKSVFEQENSNILGVIINRVSPDKLEKVKDSLGTWFAKQNIPVFGYIPYQKEITGPTTNSFLKALKTKALSHPEHEVNFRVDNFITAFGSIEKVLERTESARNGAVIIDSSRPEILYALLTRKSVTGYSNTPSVVILCGDTPPPDWTIEACRKTDLPLYITRLTTSKVSSIIESKIFKVEPEESEKISHIVKLIEKHVDFDAIYNELFSYPTIPEQPKPLIRKLIHKGARFLSKFIK